MDNDVLKLQPCTLNNSRAKPELQEMPRYMSETSGAEDYWKREESGPPNYPKNRQLSAMSKYTTDGFERKNSAPVKSSVSTDGKVERKRSAGDGQGAGAVDEEMFRASFVPAMSITAYSSKELLDIMGRIKDNLSVSAEEWEKRVDALKTLRVLVANGANQFEEFIPQLKTLETQVDGCLRDLRSSVVREACITVAYLSQQLGTRFDRFAETILQTLIGLMSNSAKIMASSGVLATRFILENTHSPRLLPILMSSMTCKSNVTRKCICEFLEVIFRTWPVNVLEKHLGLLQDSLRRGIYDADQEARGFSRRAFPLFAEKFPDQANSLLQNLDAQKRKLIEKDLIGIGLSGVGDDGSARNRSNNQSAVNPVTKRPNKPILGTAAVGANGARSRPPVTNQNDINTVGRYVRHGSVVSSTGPRGRGTGRKNVSQSQLSEQFLPIKGGHFCDPLHLLDEQLKKGYIHFMVSSCMRSIYVTVPHPSSETPSPSSDGPHQCMVVDFMVNAGLRILPETRPSSDDCDRFAPNVFDQRDLLENVDSPFLSPSIQSEEISGTTSREVSPTRLAYMSYGIPGDYNQQGPYNAAGYAGRNGLADARQMVGATSPMSPYGAGTGSRIPRSQGASREPSPTRSISGYQQPIYNTQYSSFRQRGRPSISTMSDYGDSVDTFMTNSRHPMESDDNFSETSSQCSDRSARSGFRRQPSVRVTSNLKEILGQLSGAQWSDRKDGLINLQNYMRSGSPLNPEDIRRLTEIFSKMFADSQRQVVSLFMDTLQFFIKEYNPLLRDWLYTLLIRLFNRQGSEAVGSYQKAIQEALFVVRSHFPLNLQFTNCCRYIMDNAQAPNIKVKVCLLEYLKDLILMMSPDALNSPSQEVTSAIARIISWSGEPKSPEIRRMASRVVIKLYDLNSTSFAAITQGLPRAIKDRATEVLKAYQKTTTGTGISSLMEPTPTAPAWKPQSVDQDGHLSHGATRTPNDPGRLSPETMNNMIRQTTEGLQSLTVGMQAPTAGTPRRVSTGSVPNAAHQYDSYLSYDPAQTAATNGMGEISGGVLRTMQPSNIPNPSFISPGIVPSPVSHSYAAPPVPLGDSPTSARFDNRPLGTLGFDQGDGPKLKKPVIGYQTLRKIREMPPEDIMSEILQELSNHNERYEQRKASMLKLIKLLRDGTICNWDEYFKPTLLILLETLGDDGCETRSLALKVLQELVRAKPELFHDFACLFVIKVLDACRDEEKTVTRAAEECAKSIAQHLPPDLCFSVLTPLINDTKMQVNLPAVKMQEHVVRNSPPDLVTDVLDVIIPGLIVACNHEDSSMRKASIFCMVAIALKIGDAIWEHLNDLHVSKKRLLKLYIDRELNNAVSSESLGTRS
ncbi:HEAT repeat protein, partial [Opisthorchis viverrini]